jgi:hypothetical protein
MEIEGRTRYGRKRMLECRRDGDELYLWIHSRDSRNGGWEIWIPADAARDALWSRIWKEDARK